MKKLLLSLLACVLLSACDTTTDVVQGQLEATVLPEPKSVETWDTHLVLSSKSRLYSADTTLYPLLNLFSDELETLTDISTSVTLKPDMEADFWFSIDPGLDKEAYEIEVTHKIRVSGGSYQALTMAKTSLLQLVKVQAGKLVFPVVYIRDQPDASYRGLMVDLARQWHGIKTLYQLIDLAAFYKIPYLQLHFTDYQSYTLPSDAFPSLSTPNRHYSFKQLRQLESYSQLRGVTLVPEIDVPGHSSPFVRAYPEIFALNDTSSNPWIIHMGRESVYAALDTLIGELTEVFQASPYIHIGGDEAIFTSVIDDPEVQAYMAEKELEEDVHELYRHFLVRMNEVVKRHGRQMCVWEGFTRAGTVKIPKDILVFEFETNRYLPNELVEDGYSVVNTSWKPLYVVNQKKWSPETLYNWNLWRWENWWERAPSFEPIQVEKSPLVVGAQMCAWEQPGEAEIPSLRKRLPAFAERVWNTEGSLPYESFWQRLERLDHKLSLLIEDSRQDSLLVGYEFAAGAN